MLQLRFSDRAVERVENGDRVANSYSVLIRHFFGRFFEKESLSPQSEPAASLAQILGLLAVPGAFFVLLFRPLTLVRWDLVAVRYLFVSFSMIVMGLVMVIEWDALFPDRRDYQILTPLPLKLRTLFFAKAAALAILLGAFLVDINFFGVLFWPGIDAKPDSLAIMAAHSAAVAAAGLFGALAVAALHGLVITFCRGALLRRVSLAVQSALMAALVMLFFLTPFLAFSIRLLAPSKHPALRWYPGFWFIGLYEWIRPATGNAALIALGRTAIAGLCAAGAVFLLTYLPGYRQHARRAIEAPLPRAGGPGMVRRVLARWSHQTFLKHPVERAVFHFIGETLTRSSKHRLFLSTYAGFGAALAVLNFASDRQGLITLPLTLSFVLVSGLRAAFNVPSELRANWLFQISEDSCLAEYLHATREWIVVSAILPLFAILLPVEFHYYPAGVALFHTAFGLTLALLLTEVLFFGFRKVPFTCAYFSGKVNMVGLSVIYLFGFTWYSRIMAGFESWLATRPLAALLFFATAAGLLGGAAWWRNRHLFNSPAAIDFLDPGDPVVRTLDLAS
jgi:hypothetical protein